MKTQPEPGRRGGFTLLEVIIAVAIVAIIAGAITPLAFRELMAAREDATRLELKTVSDALLAFYEDTGRFPSEAEGLGALLADPGAAGWQGPYVDPKAGNPLAELTTDSFNRTYLYDLAPLTVAAGAADLIVASGGRDLAVTAGSVGAAWTVDPAADDLLALVSRGPTDRDKIRDADSELNALAEAVRNWFEDHAAFAANLALLVPSYLDAGVDGGGLLDPWNRPYLQTITTGGANPPRLSLRSSGPDRQDDAGGDDDIVLDVSSVPPGRKATLWKLEIAQSALNSNPTLILTGLWSNDRALLGLTPAFELDGWGRPIAVNAAARAVYSVGPDGNAALVGDNLPAGVGP